MSRGSSVGHVLAVALGWVLVSLGVLVLGLAAWSAMPYWTGGSCSMALLGFYFVLPIGVSLAGLGALVLWAASTDGRPPEA